ncbi:hypothetical protein BCR39DRAFT_526157 [Naematelia encephala]|uniref:Uncharacterized protein n=1 Tax=Naematelia encephala TaxID=71784 RepID=A0A1Y2B9Y7_9TREE|nr:hypothetical protein BCR39DRAFT_526157 [Naematelia encephala]
MSRNRVPSTPRRSTASSRETRSPTGPLASSSHGRRLFPINEDEVMTIDDSPTPPSSPTLSTRAGSRALTAQRELFDRPFSAFSDGHITYRGSEIPWQRPREVSPFQRVQRARKEIGEGSGSGSGSGLQQVVGSPLPGNVYEACGRLLQVIKNALTPTLTEDEKTRIVSTPDEKLKVATTFRFVVDTLLGSEMNDTRTKIIDRVMDDQDPEGDPNITKENVSVLLGILSTSLRYLFSGSQNDFISPSSQNRTKSRSVRQAEWWASFRASLVFPAQDLRDEMNEAQVDRVLGSLRVIWIRDETSILESIKPHMTGRDSLRDTVEMVGELCKAIKNLLFSIG